MSVDEFRRRSDECRRLAAAARNAADKRFWLNLTERWQAVETQSLARPILDRRRSPLRRQTGAITDPASVDNSQNKVHKIRSERPSQSR